MFSDFRHGIFNRDTIPTLSAAIPEGCLQVADSQVASRWGNILDFQGFDLITPNEREARFALGDQDSVVRPLALELYRQRAVQDADPEARRTRHHDLPRRAQDRSRTCAPSSRSTASPTTSSMPSARATRCSPMPRSRCCATGNAVIASILGSIAAAIECEHDGNIPVDPNDVLDKIDRFERLANYR